MSIERNIEQDRKYWYAKGKLDGSWQAFWVCFWIQTLINFCLMILEVTMSNNKQSIHLREMKYIWGILKDSFALKTVCSIFDHDAHHIVSKKGWKKLKS